MDEEREEELERFTDGWPAPTSIKIPKEKLKIQGEAAAGFFQQAIPAYSGLYTDFVHYLLSLLPGTGDHIRLDIIAIASFSDVQHFAADLEKTITGIKEQDIRALGGLDADPVMLTGFPADDEAFGAGSYPELKALQSDLKAQRAHAMARPEGKLPRKNYFLPVTGILLGLFLIYAGSKGYKKKV